MSGWIKLHRSLLEDAIWKSSNDAQKVILLTILLKANHEKNEWVWKGKKFVCQPGQFVTSIRKLSEATDASVKCVRNAITKFEKLGFLGIETDTARGTGGTLITICNYSKYQQRDDSKGHTKGQEEGQARGKQGATNKNDKNDKKKERETSLPPDFEVTDQMMDWFVKQNFTIDQHRTTEAWKDAMLSKGRTYKDWKAAWRSGMRKAQDWHDEKKPNNIVPITRCAPKLKPFGEQA